MSRPCAAAVLALALLPALAASAAEPSSVRRRVPLRGRVRVPGCGSQGTYAPGSAYEANLRLLAATIPAQAANASSFCHSSRGNRAGERPDMVSASGYCYRRHDGSTTDDCAACLAMAFREAQRRCPYHRQAAFQVDSGDCGVGYHDVQRMEHGIGVIGNPAVDGDAASLLDKLYPHFRELALYSMEKILMEGVKNHTGHLNQSDLRSPPRLSV